jgi:hypothetical protein
MSACLIHILLVSPPVLIHISFSISLSLSLYRSLSFASLSLSPSLSRSLSLACLGGGDRAATRWKRQSGGGLAEAATPAPSPPLNPVGGQAVGWEATAASGDGGGGGRGSSGPQRWQRPPLRPPHAATSSESLV